jgi:hypothetical protein
MPSASFRRRLADLVKGITAGRQQKKDTQNHSHDYPAQRDALHHFSLFYPPVGVFAASKAQKYTYIHFSILPGFGVDVNEKDARIWTIADDAGGVTVGKRGLFRTIHCRATSLASADRWWILLTIRWPGGRQSSGPIAMGI